MEKEIQKIKDWLMLDPEERNFDVGALLYLKNNPRRRILYENIVRRKMDDKLAYELRKTLEIMESKYTALQRGIDYKKLTATEITAFTEQVKKVETETLPKVIELLNPDKSGKRPDHDLLPDEIKAKFDENLIIYPRMRALHEKLKLMDNELPCDRYPFLKQLVEYDEKLQANWGSYDKYDIANPPKPTDQIVIDFNRIGADRKYISDNKEKLAALQLDKTQADAYSELLEKVQVRIDELKSVNQGISEQQAEELRNLGLNI
jgi:hypothetical protein